MNWLIIISNITLTSIAASLCVLSWKTMKNIRHLNVGKSFWIPVFVSSLFFAIGSIITIFNELILSLTSIVEIGQITELIAFCSLTVSIYSYSKTIRKNLPEKYIVPEANSTQNGKKEAHIAFTSSFDKTPLVSNNLGIETDSGCHHQLGYLRTIPAHAPLPEECLICDKITECKHSWESMHERKIKN